MASFFLAPDPIQSTFFIPGGATPGSGVQLFIYVAVSVSTKTTVYKDNAGLTQWTNPIVLDSGGNLPSGGVVWIPSGVSIKAVWAPATDTDPPTSPYRTIDNIAGVNDVTSSQSDWTVGPTPTFVSASQFTLVGDQTQTFTKDRRVKFTVTAGTVFGSITSSTFGALTTVNVAFDSGALDSGLSAVSYSVITPSNSSIGPDYIYKFATTVPSSGTGTTNIWGVAGDYVHITGTNAIFNFSTAPYPGAQRTVIFDGALQLTHSSTTLGVPGSSNVTTAANDRITVRADTTANAVITQYTRGTGVPVVGAQTSSTVFAGPSSGASAVPTFRNLTGGEGASMVWLATKAAATSASLSFTTSDFDWTTFDIYEFNLVDVVPATDNTAFRAQISLDGSTFVTSNYVYGVTGEDSAGSAQNAGSSAAIAVQILTAVGNAANAGGISGCLRLYRPNNNSSHKKMVGQMFSFDSANYRSSFFGGAHNGTTAALQGIRFIFGSGNINSGSIYAYGIRKL